MGYYLITSAEYTANHSEIEYSPVYTLDSTQCIIEVADDYTVTNYIEYFVDSNAVNAYRFTETEWSNWMTEEDFNGE